MVICVLRSASKKKTGTSSTISCSHSFLVDCALGFRSTEFPQRLSMAYYNYYHTIDLLLDILPRNSWYSSVAIRDFLLFGRFSRSREQKVDCSSRTTHCEKLAVQFSYFLFLRITPRTHSLSSPCQTRKEAAATH